MEIGAVPKAAEDGAACLIDENVRGADRTVDNPLVEKPVAVKFSSTIYGYAGPTHFAAFGIQIL